MDTVYIKIKRNGEIITSLTYDPVQKALSDHKELWGDVILYGKGVEPIYIKIARS
jgi:hypothetical protein